MSVTRLANQPINSSVYCDLLFNVHINAVLVERPLWSTSSHVTNGKVKRSHLYLLISSWIIFWFVTVVPKYLNYNTFSNDLFAIFMSRFWLFWFVTVVPKYLNYDTFSNDLFAIFMSRFWPFWFVTVVPKYLNYDTFSNDLFAIFMSRLWPTFWWLISNIYLDFFTFISRPTSFPASIKNPPTTPRNSKPVQLVS
jgi:hypothetical protein